MIEYKTTFKGHIAVKYNIESISREEMTEAGILAFFAIIKEWGLRNEEGRTLLGNPSRTRFYELKRGSPTACSHLSNDELDRLAYITSIYSALNILYTSDSHSDWLRNESKLPVEAFYRPWGIGSPLKYMLSGKLQALAEVYEYISVERDII